MQLVVPLNGDGDAKNFRTRAIGPGKRLVETRPGEELRFECRRYKVTAAAAYRWEQDGIAHGWPADTR